MRTPSPMNRPPMLNGNAKQQYSPPVHLSLATSHPGIPTTPISATATTPRVYSARSAQFSQAAFLQGQPFWLALYFFFNLSLTLYNKVRARLLLVPSAGRRSQQL